MNILIWLMRASKWARHPPSPRHVRLVLAVIAAALLIVTMEWLDLWPGWAQLEPAQTRLPRLP